MALIFYYRIVLHFECKLTNSSQVANIAKVLPKVQVTYLDGQTETIQKTALLKVWMEGRNSK